MHASLHTPFVPMKKQEGTTVWVMVNKQGDSEDLELATIHSSPAHIAQAGFKKVVKEDCNCCEKCCVTAGSCCFAFGQNPIGPWVADMGSKAIAAVLLFLG